MVQHNTPGTDFFKRLRYKYGHKGKSIRHRLLIPFVLIMTLQTGVLAAYIVRGAVSTSLRTNAINIFRQNAVNDELNMERELVQHWISDINNSEMVRDTIERILKQEEKSSSEIGKNAQLNQKIINAIMPQMLDLLHRSYGNGVYVILDGPASDRGDEKERAGVYICDMDSSSYAMDNSDLMLFRGTASISRQYKIPLHSFWSLGFELQEGDLSADFFYKPYLAAKDTPIRIKDAPNYAYMADYAPQDTQKNKGLSYSLPLVMSDGTTVGVIGGDLLEDHVRKSMELKKQTRVFDGFSFLAKRNRGENELIPVITEGVVFEEFFGARENLLYRDSSWPGIAKVEDHSGETWYAAIIPIEIYNNNTPFESEEWLMVQLQDGPSLFGFYENVKNILLVAIAASLVLGILSAVVVSNLVVNPIQKLIGELRSVAIGKGIRFRRTKINEIDELIGAIESLSKNVADSSFRFSKIMENSGVPVGVFEYLNDNKTVFCSKGLAQLLGIEWSGDSYQYMSKEEFDDMISVLQEPIYEDGDRLFRLEKAGKYYYLRLRLMFVSDENVTGVLTDITATMEEKIKLERERNYDLLTGLFNRRAFRERVENILENEPPRVAALVMWDLDNLKYVNDTYGHEAGDRYICLFARYLQTLEERGAVVERHSGDEFLAFLYSGEKDEICNKINHFMQKMGEITLDVGSDYAIPLRASAGMVWYPEQADSLDVMIGYADFAMYMAKHSVKGIVKEFSAESYRDNSYLLSGSEELSQLLESKSVAFELQPIVARDGSIYGYEALMRPQLKNFKNVLELLTLAKNQAKLPQFEELSWYSAMEWLYQRRKLVSNESRFFINSISSTFLSEECIAELEEKYGEILSRVVMEMTEAEQQEEECMRAKQNTIKRWGGGIALDDYGTGYNTDTTLLKLNPDIIKLDIAMVQGICQDENRQVLAHNIIEYCHKRNILVVAEGVERLEELEMLMNLNVDLFQGYYLARPESEVRPLNPYVISKMQELSQK